MYLTRHWVTKGESDVVFRSPAMLLKMYAPVIKHWTPSLEPWFDHHEACPSANFSAGRILLSTGGIRQRGKILVRVDFVINRRIRRRGEFLGCRHKRYISGTSRRTHKSRATRKHRVRGRTCGSRRERHISGSSRRTQKFKATRKPSVRGSTGPPPGSSRQKSLEAHQRHAWKNPTVQSNPKA